MGPKKIDRSLEYKSNARMTQYPVYLDSHPCFVDPPPIGSIFNLEPDYGFYNSFVILKDCMRRIRDPDEKNCIVLTRDICDILAEKYGSVMYAYKMLMDTDIHISYFSKIYISFNDEFLKNALSGMNNPNVQDLLEDILIEFDEKRWTFTWTIQLKNKGDGPIRGIPLTELGHFLNDA